jgi:hypothetical protein
MNRAGPRGGGTCPVCGRFVGAVQACPYCEAEGLLTTPVRLLRWAAVLLAVVGVALLWLAASRQEAPRVAMREITPSFHGARVCVSGQLAAAPRLVRRGGRADYVGMTLCAPGGAEVRVSVSGVAADALVRRGLPPVGSLVEAVGRLDVQAGRRPCLRVAESTAVRMTAGPRVGGRG